MKKIILIFAVFTLTVLEVSAQKLLVNQIIDGVTYLAIIDNSTLPLGTIKTPSELLSQKTSGRMNRHDKNSEINKKVSNKFVVAKADFASGNRMSWAVASGWDPIADENYVGVTTTIANTGCSMYSERSGDIGSWRLPTQRELMLIYQMRTALESINGFSAFISFVYWSSTERRNNSWSVSFSDGGVSNFTKNINDLHVRCIKDL